MIDVVATRNTVADTLESMGFSNHDADISDFSRPNSDVRFKVGTTRGEVSITVWREKRQTYALRIISDGSLDLALEYLKEVAK